MEILMLRCEMVDEQEFLAERQQQHRRTLVTGGVAVLRSAQAQGQLREGLDLDDLMGRQTVD